jgi:hypothetical protein
MWHYEGQVREPERKKMKGLREMGGGKKLVDWVNGGVSLKS